MWPIPHAVQVGGGCIVHSILASIFTSTNTDLPRCPLFPSLARLRCRGLLLLLWVPLLVFSSGNPTYQVPSVTAFSVNASLTAAGAAGGASAARGSGSGLHFPLFAAGDRRTAGTWAGAWGLG